MTCVSAHTPSAPRRPGRPSGCCGRLIDSKPEVIRAIVFGDGPCSLHGLRLVWSRLVWLPRARALKPRGMETLMNSFFFLKETGSSSLWDDNPR